jgi:hypothetical protein
MIIKKMNTSQDERLGEHYTRYSNNQWIPSNGTLLSQHSTSQVYTTEANQQRSLILEPDVEYSTYERYLVIRSEDRDISNYPQPQNYRINMEHEFRNIDSIELITAIIPDKQNVTREPYLLLDIPELKDEPMECISSVVSNSFAILQMAPAVTSGYFISIDKRTHENVIKYYKNPKASLNSITIRILDNRGALFNFGDDTGGTPPNKEFQNMFVFKIVIKEKSHKQLNHRTVH